MIYFNLKEQLLYYLTETDIRLKDKFYTNVLFDILSTLIRYSLKKCGVFETDSNYQDLTQELHIHILKYIDSIIDAKDSNAYLITICKNYTIKFIKWQRTHFMPVQSGEN